MTLTALRGWRAARGDPRLRGGRTFWLALTGFLLVGAACAGIAFYFAVHEPGQDPGLPLSVTVRALGVHALPVATPLPSLLPRPRPRAGPPRGGEGGTSTAPATPIGGGDGEHRAAPARSPEPAAEAPVLVPEGEQRP